MLAVDAEAFGFDIFARFNFNRYDPVLVLFDKINFSGGVVSPVEEGVWAVGVFLENELFGEETAKFVKNTVGLEDETARDIGEATEETEIEEVKFEAAGVSVGLER